MKREIKISRVALHEGAHVIVALSLGCTVTGCYIGDACGGCYFAPPSDAWLAAVVYAAGDAADFAGDTWSKVVDDPTPAQISAISISRGAADVLVAADDDASAGQSDYEKIAEKVSHLVVGGVTLHALYQKARDEAAEILRENVGALRRVASELAIRGSLQREEILSLCSGDLNLLRR